jgi:competence protein ComEA
MPNDLDSHHYQFDIAQQQTISCSAIPPFAFTEQSTQPLSISFASTTTELSSHDPTEDKANDEKEEATKKPRKKLPLVILVIIGLGCAAYFIWRTPATNSSTVPIVAQSFSTNTSTDQKNTSNSTTTDAPNSTIEVYVTGAVQHPGVYTLSSNARVYQLLQMAGGPLPDANLITLNLAAKLADGQEIYVSKVGETAPITNSAGTTANNQGQLVNINSASMDDLKQKLHLSSKSAQDIINYRQQHGPFTSIDALLQAVSQTIYNKIKNQITI